MQDYMHVIHAQKGGLLVQRLSTFNRTQNYYQPAQTYMIIIYVAYCTAENFRTFNFRSFSTWKPHKYHVYRHVL